MINQDYGLIPDSVMSSFYILDDDMAAQRSLLIHWHRYQDKVTAHYKWRKETGQLESIVSGRCVLSIPSKVNDKYKTC